MLRLKIFGPRPPWAHQGAFALESRSIGVEEVHGIRKYNVYIEKFQAMPTLGVSGGVSVRKWVYWGRRRLNLGMTHKL